MRKKENHTKNKIKKQQINNNNKDELPINKKNNNHQHATEFLNTSTMADKADRHLLYQEAVQSPKADITFCSNVVFQKYRHRKALLFKEDFSGTSILGTEWVKSDPERYAICVDFDRETLEWGRTHHVEAAGSIADRIELVHANVLDREVNTKTKVDIIASFNYSICLFHQRRDVENYFRVAYDTLVDDGILICDLLGGYQSTINTVQYREYPSFKYTWRCGQYDAMTNRIKCSISFGFPDQSSLQGAFTYDFRLWNIADWKEMMLEAGFKDIKVFWRNERIAFENEESKDTNSDDEDQEESSDQDEEDDDDIVDENKKRYLEKKKMKQLKQQFGRLDNKSRRSNQIDSDEEEQIEQKNTDQYVEVKSIPQTARWNVYIVALK